MTHDRILALSLFLADPSSRSTDFTTSRPSPDLGRTLVMQSFLDPLSQLIGKGNKDLIEFHIRENFLNVPEMETRIEKMWNAYGSDQAFFAWISTLLSLT